MSAELTAEEVFEVAKRVERLGAELYTKLAEQTADKDRRQQFLDLAKMEAEHEMVFDAMKHHLGKLGWAAPPDSPTAALWEIVADQMMARLNLNLPSRFKNKTSRQDIIHEAMAFEKDTIILLLAMADMIPQTASKKKINELVKEELGHLLLLCSQLSKPAEA